MNSSFYLTIIYVLITITLSAQFDNDSLLIPIRHDSMETGSQFMGRVKNLPLAEREEEIYKSIASGNFPDFLRNFIPIDAQWQDKNGTIHSISYAVMSDYLSVGSDTDFCRIPMNPYTAQRLSYLFHASLITSKLSNHIYKKAEVKLAPHYYAPVGNANETTEKFTDHNIYIQQQLEESNSRNGQLVAGIKKDIVLSARLSTTQNKVVIYGWHKTDGKPIQPVYSGHVDWYVDYSHGIRFIHDKILLDGKSMKVSDVLSDPILFSILSDEDTPMVQTVYIKK